MTHRLCFHELSEGEKRRAERRLKKYEFPLKRLRGLPANSRRISGCRFFIFRRERSDDRKYVCCSQASISSGREEIRVSLETPAGEAMFSLWSICCWAEHFFRCLLTYRRLLAVFTFKFSSEELRGFKFKKRATFKNVKRRSALNVFSFNDSRYFMNAVE